MNEERQERLLKLLDALESIACEIAIMNEHLETIAFVLEDGYHEKEKRKEKRKRENLSKKRI